MKTSRKIVLDYSETTHQESQTHASNDLSQNEYNNENSP